MQNLILIHRLNGDIPSSAVESKYTADSKSHAAFSIPSTSALYIKARNWSEQAGDYLDHTISRNQNDLRAHVQRIYLYIARKDENAVYGALLDLFIVLGDQGLPLRTNMLKASRRIIDGDRLDFLYSHLESGISNTDVVPTPYTSLLTKGLIGTNQLVTKNDIQAKSSQDPLEEARDYLEYGEIGEARQVLENAILINPRRQELHHDLLEIYKRTNDKEAFLNMRKLLDTNNIPATSAWIELAGTFEKVS